MDSQAKGNGYNAKTVPFVRIEVDFHASPLSPLVTEPIVQDFIYSCYLVFKLIAFAVWLVAPK